MTESIPRFVYIVSPSSLKLTVKFFKILHGDARVTYVLFFVEIWEYSGPICVCLSSSIKPDLHGVFEGRLCSQLMLAGIDEKRECQVCICVTWWFRLSSHRSDNIVMTLLIRSLRAAARLKEMSQGSKSHSAPSIPKYFNYFPYFHE
jgi:hypothetical protein